MRKPVIFAPPACGDCGDVMMRVGPRPAAANNFIAVWFCGRCKQAWDIPTVTIDAARESAVLPAEY